MTSAVFRNNEGIVKINQFSNQKSTISSELSSVKSRVCSEKEKSVREKENDKISRKNAKTIKHNFCKKNNAKLCEKIVLKFRERNMRKFEI